MKSIWDGCYEEVLSRGWEMAWYWDGFAKIRRTREVCWVNGSLARWLSVLGNHNLHRNGCKVTIVGMCHRRVCRGVERLLLYLGLGNGLKSVRTGCERLGICDLGHHATGLVVG